MYQSKDTPELLSLDTQVPIKDRADCFLEDRHRTAQILVSDCSDALDL